MAVVQRLLLLFFFTLGEHLSYGQFYLYQTNTVHDLDDYDCLDYYALDDISNFNELKPYRQGHQIIPFCRRDGENHQNELEKESTYFTSSSLTFKQLKERNVSSAQLYTWTAPIDTIEEYEAFINGHGKENGHIFFYNCTSFKRFGRRCEYSFPTQINVSRLFTDIVKSTRKSISRTTDGTYYSHLNCTRGPNTIWRVDWRDVCDGKMDCWNGADEAECWQLEQNVCNAGEYRCLNGQCIPGVFYNDNAWNPDCMDGTDEPPPPPRTYPRNCPEGDPSIRCEDTICRHWTQKPCRVDSDCAHSGSCHSIKFNAFILSLLTREANPHLNYECWATMYCIIMPLESVCASIGRESNNSSFTSRIREHCPPIFAFPASPIAFGHILYVHTHNRTKNDPFQFACYSDELCGKSLISTDLLQPVPYEFLMPCRNYSSLQVSISSATWIQTIENIEIFFNRACSFRSRSNDVCPETTHFRCDSKCFSKDRRGDFMNDCSDKSDEIFSSKCDLKDTFRRTCTYLSDNITRCVPKIVSYVLFTVTNPCLEEEEQDINFATLCDGILHRKWDTRPVKAVSPNDETDETNCEEWLCDNQYTRCDMLWNCPNGADEARCEFSMCKPDYHPCFIARHAGNESVGSYICLPLSRAGDGIIDCLGGTDERQFCHHMHAHDIDRRYLCLNNRTVIVPSPSIRLIQDSKNNHTCISYDQICNKYVDCQGEGDDELAVLCESTRNGSNHCLSYQNIVTSYISETNIFCSINEFNTIITRSEQLLLYFSLANKSILLSLQTHILQQPVTSLSIIPKIMLEIASEPVHSDDATVKLHCYGGIPVMVFNKTKCFCPPSLYGEYCQYQNQRISLSIQIGASQWRTPFHFIIFLFDMKNEQTVQSYHHLSYLSIRDCNTKFHLNLLYLSRPKFANSSYAIRIDVFDVDMLEYRASWIYPVVFPFLPVYRLAIQLVVPSERVLPGSRCSLKCGSHGKCAVYANTGSFFCHCDSEWSGDLCQNRFTCDCSKDSLCVGTRLNRSICVCPINKFGPRCYLTNTACRDLPVMKQCKNGGRCISTDRRIPASVLPSTTCACLESFQGTECQRLETRLDIFFSKTIIPPEFIYLHFITVKSFPPMNGQSVQSGPHERATTFRKISIDQHMISVYWNNSFHIVFAQIEEKIFLLLVQYTYEQWAHLNVTLEKNQQCPSLRELVNTTIFNFEQLRRVKYYHKPCQEQLQLSCFHDEKQFICLCTYDRRANCMTFDFNMKYDCTYFSNCENGGQCYQDNEKCPTASICACPACYFGARCQLSAQGFGLSLDAILGYRIRPHVPFTAQSDVIKISLAVTVSIFILGLLSGILSIITFSAKKCRLVGCGIYLFSASVNAILIVTIFGLKFLFLLLIQMALITDRLILNGQCASIDFLLKVFVQTGDWLYTCAIVERAFSVLKGVNFDKNRSKKVAPWMILFVLTFTISTSIHEVLSRTIIDDEEEGRQWCIVQYSILSSKALTNYTALMNIVHFIGPFTINLISAFLIIIVGARYRSNAQKNISYTKHLQSQFRQHKYLIISPISLVLLALPRLILAFTLGCMKSARDSVTLFLVGYFVSFIPSLLTFIVFILPSKFYMKEFRTQIDLMYKKFLCH